MNAEQRKVHERLLAEELPPGWTCERAWPWGGGTHLVAPGRKGGVVVQHRSVIVQLPGTGGPCSPQVRVGDFWGRGWLDRMVDAAVRAAREYAPEFKSRRK